MRACYLVWPLTFMVAPLCNYFLRRGWNTAFWVVGKNVSTISSLTISYSRVLKVNFE